MNYYLHGIDQTFSHSIQVGQYILGRGEQATIIINDPSVSSTHAEFELRTDGSATVRDLNSTNGVFLGCEKVSEAILNPGQELSIGDVRLKFDTVPVDVNVPQIEVPKQPEPSWLPDGRPACLQHPDTPAVHLCRQCSHTLCDACVRRVGLKGGRPKIFCELCSGPCGPVSGNPGRKRKRSKIHSILQSIERFFRD